MERAFEERPHSPYYGAVDTAGNAYVVGTTASLFFPVRDAFQPTSHVRGPTDAFVTKLNTSAARILYSSYLGGSGGASTLTGWDEGTAIALDAARNAYVAGATKSYDFPTTPGAFQGAIGGGVCDYFGGPCGDAFVARVSAGGPGPLPATRVQVTPPDVVRGATLTATRARQYATIRRPVLAPVGSSTGTMRSPAWA